MTVSCLHKFAALLKEKHANKTNLDKEIDIDTQPKELGFLIMELIACTLSHSSLNAKIFRELGGARLAHNMVPYKICRNQALKIGESLSLIVLLNEFKISKFIF